jgi:hypothetical protein
MPHAPTAKVVIVDGSEGESEVRYEQWIPGLALMRDALLTSFGDADLERSLGGMSLTLGQLIDDCAAMQRSYICAFDDLNQTWDPPRPSKEHLPTVVAIRERFVSLDRKLALVRDGYDEAQWQAVISADPMGRSAHGAASLRSTRSSC